LDLEARLAALQGDMGDTRTRTTAPHRTGEILGMHTIGELSDLLDALSYTVGQLTAAYNECADAWKAADAASHDAWKADFDKGLARFGTAWDEAHALLWLPDLTPIVDILPGVLPSAATKAWKDVTSTIHTFTELDRRMRAAGICSSPTYKDMPQPTRSDVDLKAYNLSGDVLAGIKKGVRAVGEAATSPVPWLAAGGILALLLVAALRR
jgi:hypothetical protein